MKFELGKYYQHSGGQRLHMIALAQTRMYGLALLGEALDGSITPCGLDETNAVNWTEISLIEFEATCERMEYENAGGAVTR